MIGVESESLNAGAACAVILGEIQRQRQQLTHSSSTLPSPTPSSSSSPN